MKIAVNRENEMVAGGNNRANPLLKVDVTEPMKIAELEYHPLHKKFIGDSVTVDLEGMAQSIRQNGMLDPITILRKSKLVIDGFHRIEAAKKAGLKVVPARRTKTELTGDQILKVMYQSLVHRKHVTKQQRVAVWVTYYGGEETFKANYKRDKGPLPEGSDQITNQMIAARFGEKPNTVSKYVNEVLFGMLPEVCTDSITDTNSDSTKQPSSDKEDSSGGAQDFGPNNDSSISAKAVTNPKRKVSISGLMNADHEHILKMLIAAFRTFERVLDHSPERYGKLIEGRMNRLLKKINAKRIAGVMGGVR